MRKYDDQGREIMDGTPMAVPVGFHRPPTLAEQIKRLVRSEALRQAAESAGAETFEEADDFAVEDFDPRSPHELSLDQELEAVSQTPPSQPVPEKPMEEEVPVEKKASKKGAPKKEAPVETTTVET